MPGCGIWGERMSKRALAVAVAALGLIAWLDPKTAAPEVSKGAAAEEAKRQLVYVYKARAKEQLRVHEIAFRIEVANQDLCPERAPRVGVHWATSDDYPVKTRDAAIEALRLGDGPTLTEVLRSGPAAAAGLQVGDVVVSINGEAVPIGRDATTKLDKRLHEVIGQSTAPIRLEVRRAGQIETIAVTPVLACAYPAVMEDSEEVNARADGRVLHVNRGLLRFVESDEELAVVIGHELAHNGQHHIQAQLHNGRMVGFGGLLLDGVAAAYGVNTKGAFTKAGMQIGMEHAAPEFEAEADYVGLYYMARAGFSTDGAENLWRKMSVDAPDSIFIKTDHPTNPERYLAIAAASKEIEEKRAKGEPLVPNQKVVSDQKGADRSPDPK
jgi:membrane-associated protease RseP (regulator of RpoE activity)